MKDWRLDWFLPGVIGCFCAAVLLILMTAGGPVQQAQRQPMPAWYAPFSDPPPTVHYWHLEAMTGGVYLNAEGRDDDGMASIEAALVDGSPPFDQVAQWRNPPEDNDDPHYTTAGYSVFVDTPHPGDYTLITRVTDLGGSQTIDVVGVVSN
jgi:hypothetical protein